MKTTLLFASGSLTGFFLVFTGLALATKYKHPLYGLALVFLGLFISSLLCIKAMKKFMLLNTIYKMRGSDKDVFLKAFNHSGKKTKHGTRRGDKRKAVDASIPEKEGAKEKDRRSS